MDNLVFRGSRGAADVATLIGVHEACYETDQVDVRSPEEYVPTLDWYINELQSSHPDDWVIVEVAGQVVGYGHTLWHWQERDGTEVYLHLGWIIPNMRGQGIGLELLTRLEQRCREKAILNGHLAQLEIAGNGTDDVSRELLQANDYFTAFTMLEMRLDAATVLPPSNDLPADYELRPVLPEHHLAIWQCIGDAYDARNIDNPRFAEAIRKEDKEHYFSSDPSLMFVAWEKQGERVAGQVLARVRDTNQGEIFEVSIGVGHRRKGIARTLLLMALHELRARGAQEIVLGTRLENSTFAWKLYEQVGFRIRKRFARMRKTRRGKSSA